ncbi:MAG: 2-phospho-L-lactate guanylyltransferase [Actinomycetes bacterium]|jgi:2-phospho-L-lactate guanylyltransferase
MWHVVIPMKGTDDAKSRLDLPSSTRDRVVQAMAADTLGAVLATPAVARVSVLSRAAGLRLDAPGASAVEVVIQPEAQWSLDRALTWFALTHTDGSSGLAVVVADLPALRAESMADVLRHSALHRVAMVTDTRGSGTTILATSEPAGLRTHFGKDSAAAHRAAGAVHVPSTPDTQCDVDTVEDLERARAIGLGPHTLELLVDLDLAL